MGKTHNFPTNRRDHKAWLYWRTLDVFIMMVMNVYCCTELFLQL